MSAVSVTFAARRVSATLQAAASALDFPRSSVEVARESEFYSTSPKLVVASFAPSVSVSLAPITEYAGNVIDSLESDSATKPLAARQGKILDGKVGAHEARITSLESQTAKMALTGNLNW